MPTARGGAATVTIGNKIYVIAGDLKIESLIALKFMMQKKMNGLS